MTSAELLIDAFGMIREAIQWVVDGLAPEQLASHVDSEADSIAWPVWHMARSKTTTWLRPPARAYGPPRLGEARFGLPFDPRHIGYGHWTAKVAAMGVESL